MNKEPLRIQGSPAIIWGATSPKVYLYIHGQGGCKEEAEDFSHIAERHGWQVLSIDLPEHGDRAGERDGFYPWTVVPELRAIMEYTRNRWEDVALFANSIGAWFSMLSFGNETLQNCLFVSPVLDMEKLIQTMMKWAGVSQEQLRQEQTIPTDFGQTLSWRYWEYVRENRITRWSAPTNILYAGKDHLTDRATAEGFAKAFHCDITIWEDGEHWFHTPPQLKVLYRWIEDTIDRQGQTRF